MFCILKAAADAMMALGDYAAKDPASRELLKNSFVPVLLQLLHTTSHDGTRVSVVAAVKILTWPPANADFRCAPQGHRASEALSRGSCLCCGERPHPAIR